MKKLLLVGVLALLLVALCALPAFAGKGTPAASEIAGSERQSISRQGNQTGEAVQSGPCGPACRRSQEIGPSGAVTVTVTVTKTVYVVYCPVVFGPSADTAPDILAPVDAN